MPFNGSGTFTNPYNWNNDKTNGVLITASRMQTQDDGIATGLTNVICKDGQQTTTAQIPFAVGIAVNQGTAMAPSVAISGDTTTGLYQSAAGAVDITASGTRVGGFTSAGLVNTAVGASTPSSGSFTTLIASGNFAINTNKLTVNASTGNTAIAGTLGVTGASTLASASITGAATVGSTLGVTGNVSINTNKFNITASSGAWSSAGAGTIGANGGTLGSLILAGSTSGSATIKVAASAGTSTNFRLPNNNGSSGNVLQTDGSGNTSWGTGGVFTKSFTSTQQTLTSGGALTLAHSLGTTPLVVQTYLVAQNSVSGFTAGDVLLVSFGTSFSASGSANTNGSITIDSTNINIRFTSQTAIFTNMTNKSDGTGANFTNTDWKLVVKAFA